MTAFDTAWDLVKDFFFQPEETMKTISTRDDGSVLSFSDKMGEMKAPMIGEIMENIADNIERRRKGLPESYFEPPKHPFVEGKHRPAMIPRTVVMERDERGFYPRSIDTERSRRRYGGQEGLPHFVGVNLSAMRGGEDDTKEILDTLFHEHSHAAIDDELMQALYDDIHRATSQEEAQNAYMRYLGAHEYGAYQLQNPGGSREAARARFQTAVHPNWKLANPKPPRFFGVINYDGGTNKLGRDIL